MDDRFKTPMLSGALAGFDMDDTSVVVADAWTLDDGRDVVPQTDNKPATIENRRADRHPMEKTVWRMRFAGVTNLVPSDVQSAIGQVTSMIGALPDPLFFDGAPVSAINYKRAQGNGAYGCDFGSSNPAKSGGIDLRKNDHDVDLGQRCFQTIPFRVNNAYDQSPPAEVFKAGDKYYMGCKQAQANIDLSDSSTYNCH
jgi:hypothetical protein